MTRTAKTVKNAPKAKKPHAFDDLFTFTSEATGAVFEMPYIENLPFEVVDDMASLETEMQLQRHLLDALLSNEERQALRKMPLREVAGMFEKWQTESSMTLGEL
ncbi:hypothetical protein ACUH96_00935 [Dermabacteraceae bacterium P13077]